MRDERKTKSQLIAELSAARAEASAEPVSAQRLDLALKGANDGLWDWNLETDEVFYSPRWKSMLGYQEHEIAHAPDAGMSRLHPDDLERTTKLIEDYLSGSTDKYEIEFRMRHKDGHYVDLLSRGFAVRDAQGRAVRLVGTHVDISDLKRAEEALRESEERYRVTFEQAATGIAQVAIDGSWLRVNSKLCEILGFSRQELLERTFQELTHPDDLDLSLQQIRKSLRGEIDNYSMEKRYLRRDGSIMWADLSVALVRDRHGAPRYFVSIIDDISERKRMEAALQFTQFAVDHSSVAAYWVCRDGSIRYVNDSACRCLGYTREELLSMTVPAMDPRFDAESWVKHWDQIRRTGSVTREAFHRTRDGRLLPIEISVNHLVFEGEEYHCTFALDISERKHAEQMLRFSEERFRDFAETAADWFWETDADLNINFLSPRFDAVTGQSATQAVGRQLAETFGGRMEPPECMARFLADIHARRPFDKLEVARDLPEGGRRVFSVSGRPRLDAAGVFVGYRGAGTDITESHRLAEELSFQASHDELTGLVNRREFELRLGRTLETARSQRVEHALCYLDLDRFKIINDTCGHVAGDELLRQLGQNLSEQVRKRDTLARLGGDEFGILMEHCTLDQALRVAESVRANIEEYRFQYDGKSFDIGASIGLVPITASSPDLTHILREADNACYVAKDSGRNRVQVFREDDAEVSRRQGDSRWVTALNRALQDDRFQLRFQRIVPVDAGPPEGEHYELLVQLKDERGEVIAPGAFLPAAERYQLASRIDRWVVRTAFGWFRDHPPVVERLHLCAINLSGQSLGDKDFLDFVVCQFSKNCIPPAKICFEITETMVIADLTNARRLIAGLKNLGCRFALDDFGSGLSSFGYLKTLPVDYVKIDGQFVKDIAADPLDLAMVRSINEMGQLMGKRTIAEYVETEAILKELRELGVDYAQGFGVGMPQPIERLT